MNRHIVEGAVLQGMGSLGWSSLPWGQSLFAGRCSGDKPRQICATPSDLGYVNNHQCQRQGSASCTTSGGNTGSIYCCPSLISEAADGGSGGVSAGEWPVYGPTPEQIYGGSGTIQTGSGGPTMTCRTEAPRSGGTTYWREIQQRLCNLGFNPGRIDGLIGNNTRTAIRAFQQANGLPSTGQIDASTSARLGTSAQPATGGGGSSPTPERGGGGNGNDTDTGSSVARFFSVSNPTMWLTLAGVMLMGGGVVYGVVQYRKSQAAPQLKSRSMPDTLVQDDMAAIKAELAAAEA